MIEQKRIVEAATEIAVQKLRAEGITDPAYYDLCINFVTIYISEELASDPVTRERLGWQRANLEGEVLNIPVDSSTQFIRLLEGSAIGASLRLSVTTG